MFQFNAYNIKVFIGMAAGCVYMLHAHSQQRPNIILLVADDLGYGDVGCFAQDGLPSPREAVSGSTRPVIFTPRIDRLAEGGMKWTDFYANCSVCSPTRAAILTGRYQHRSGVVNVLGQTRNAFLAVYPEADVPFVGLPRGETTLAEVLKDGGYRTACIGKWHLGPLEGYDGYHPLDRGFEHFVGVEGTAGNKFSMRHPNGHSIFYRGRQRVEAPGYYFTYVVADETIDFISRDDLRPFFIYVPFTAPHPSSRIGPGDKEAANAWDWKGSFRTDYTQVHKELVEALDLAVGRIHDALVERGIEENTLIFFTSDNGQNGYGYPPFNQHLGKQSLYEGGIRVPTVAHWPGVIKPGTISDYPAMTMDLFPTFLSMSRIPLPGSAKSLDGTDLMPIFTGNTMPVNRKLFWEKPYQVWMEYFANRIFAVRDGEWKLLRSHIHREPELYNLKDDPSEINNLAATYPERVLYMTRAFEEWKEEVYAEAPYLLGDFIIRLKEAGIITDASTAEVREGY